MRRRVAFAFLLLAHCSRPSAPHAEPDAAPPVPVTGSPRVDPGALLPPGATACASSAPTCFHFRTPENALRHVLARKPRVLAIGEAHAQKGSEKIASATKRFTESFLPILAPDTSDVVVELWAPDPRCMKEVKQVASAQKPVTEVQAATNQNEYLTLGTRAKAAGVTPWLLQPTCDDFSMLADAGAADIGAMLGLVKRLTQARVTRQLEKTRDKTVIAYGGALHNDLVPAPEMRDYSFGPELDQLSQGRYVELDLIVPEYVKKTPPWEKLPWYAAFQAEPRDRTTLYALSERSFVLVFPETPAQ